MKIAVASDHAGFEGEPPYKPEIIRHLQSRGHEVVDCGPAGPGSVDYPDFANEVCRSVLGGAAERGVLLCGTGIGMSIAANRHPGIRAAACTLPEAARLAREHNDANVLCIGKRLLSLQQCLDIIDVWLDTAFSGGDRHKRRVAKMG